MAGLPTKNTKEDASPWIHCFFYGESGTGKTTIAATFPRPLFLVPKNESSMVTLNGRNFDYIEIIDRNSPFANGVGGMDKVLDAIERLYNSDPGSFPHDTIVIESLSHYTDLVQEELTQRGAVNMDQGRWGKLSQHLRSLQARLRNLDVHAVFTALAEIKTDDSNNAFGGPLIPGQMSRKLPAACDIVGFCDVVQAKDPRYKVHFRKRGFFQARSRFRKVPAEIENCTYADLMSYVKASRDESAAADVMYAKVSQDNSAAMDEETTMESTNGNN